MPDRPDLADDLVRENDAEALSWIHVTLRHQATRLDQKSRQRAFRELLILDQPLESGQSEGATWGDTLQEHQPGVEDVAVTAVHASRVLTHLSPQELAVLGLTFRGMSTAEVARALKLGTRTVQRSKVKVVRLIRAI